MPFMQPILSPIEDLETLSECHAPMKTYEQHNDMKISKRKCQPRLTQYITTFCALYRKTLFSQFLHFGQTVLSHSTTDSRNLKG